MRKCAFERPERLRESEEGQRREGRRECDVLGRSGFCEGRGGEGRGGEVGEDKRGYVWERVDGDLRSLEGWRRGFVGGHGGGGAGWLSSHISCLLGNGKAADGDDCGGKAAGAGTDRLCMYSMGEKDGDKGGRTGADGARDNWDGTYECLRSALPSFAALSSCTAVLKRFQKLGSWTMMANMRRCSFV